MNILKLLFGKSETGRAVALRAAWRGGWPGRTRRAACPCSTAKAMRFSPRTIRACDYRGWVTEHNPWRCGEPPAEWYSLTERGYAALVRAQYAYGEKVPPELQRRYGPPAATAMPILLGPARPRA
jgi:hypothetical protein